MCLPGHTHTHAHTRTREMYLAWTKVHSPQLLPLPPALRGPELGRGTREEAGGAEALPETPGGRSVSPVRGAPGAQSCAAPAPETQTMNIP